VKSDGDRRELPPDIPCTAATWHGGKPGMIAICKAVLSGSAPARIREQTAGLEPGWLRDLAVKLAGDPSLTVSVITLKDGTRNSRSCTPARRITPSRPSTATGSPASPDRPCPSPSLPMSRTPSPWSAPSCWPIPLPEGRAPEASAPEASAPKARYRPLPPLDPPATARPHVPHGLAQVGQHG
jgi:hypothetical protein